LTALADWVRAGGGIVMIGGYLSFSGIEGKAAFHGTAVEDVLPVRCAATDDRVERPDGVQPRVAKPDHPVTEGIEGAWPHLLGYNRVELREGAEVLASIGGDPLVAVRQVGQGRSAVFTSDCAPHWAPPEFSHEWPGYVKLFDNLVRWVASA
jgi:uncharacterized membrane protein